jgi:hypothetical protein
MEKQVYTHCTIKTKEVVWQITQPLPPIHQFKKNRCGIKHSVPVTVFWRNLLSTSSLVTGLIPNEVIGFLNCPVPSSCTMVLESTQPLTEMSTRDLPGGKGLPASKADNLTAICELIV